MQTLCYFEHISSHTAISFVWALDRAQDSERVFLNQLDQNSDILEG